MPAAEDPGRRTPRWVGVTIWVVCALAVAGAALWAVCDPSAVDVVTFPAEAVPAVLPTEAEMSDLFPGAKLFRESRCAISPLTSSPGFLAGQGQTWGLRQTPHLGILVAVFDSQVAAVRAHARWEQFRSLPWRPVGLRRIGERCRYEPQAGWSIEFFKGNVYVMVSTTSPGNEMLARSVARLLESRIGKVLDQP